VEKLKAILAISWKNFKFLYLRFMINLAMNMFLVAFVKLTTGSHRPHFFETCVPDKLANCTANEYVDNYVCTNDKILGTFRERNTFQSFFSGHASLAWYTSFFLVIYVQYRFKSNQQIFGIPFLQSILISIAFFISISRVRDNIHHVVDIVAGTLIGIGMALHIFLTQCNDFNFEYERNRKDMDKENCSDALES
jgi:phosphatidate phosphatase